MAGHGHKSPDGWLWPTRPPARPPSFRVRATRTTSSRPDCCKSAKPQMLNATHKSIPFENPPKSRKTTATTATRPQSSSICLPSIMAAHCGITAKTNLNLNHPTIQLYHHPARTTHHPNVRPNHQRGIANKKGGKSTLLWHLILIFSPRGTDDSWWNEPWQIKLNGIGLDDFWCQRISTKIYIHWKEHYHYTEVFICTIFPWDLNNF